MAKKKIADTSIEEKLDALHNLQQIDSEIDRIRTIRGELPLEVRDLEDEIEGLELRLTNLDEELNELNTEVSNHKNNVKDAQALIKKYKDQQNNVRNNREFDSITKEIEFQELEIQLAEKKTKEINFKLESKKEIQGESKTFLEERKKDLEAKNNELESITAETQKDEETLTKKSEKAKKGIEERLINAYERLRGNARNGLAVVAVERDSCGGCFNKIPPQRQLDIRSKKKIIVCEHCGRILVDSGEEEVVVEKKKTRAKKK